MIDYFISESSNSEYEFVLPLQDESLSKEEKENLEFLVLSDQGAVVALEYGVAWEIPEFILEHMKKDRDLDLTKINNGKRNILPIPATFVIGKDGVVAWQYTSVDFRTWAEPEDIIKALKGLKKDKELNLN